MKIRFYHARILTMKEKEAVFEGEVHIKDDRIVYVGTAKDAPKDSWDREIDANGNLLMPGFKNAHTHSAMTLLRSYADDLSLQDWLYQKIFPIESRLTDDAIYWGSVLAIMEYLSGGITAGFDMYMRCEHTARASLDTGFRMVFCGSVNDFTGSVPQMEEDYYRYNDEKADLLFYQLGFHAEYTTKRETLEQIAALSQKLKAPVYMHNSETKKEVEECKKRYGKTPMTFLDSIGMFEYGGGGFHCVHMTKEDLLLCQKKKIWVITNPSSNCKLASGIAPIQEMDAMGIPLAIGTDGAASNNCLDMFREMFLVTGLQKLRCKDAAAMDANRVLQMATTGSAHAMGLDECDTLEAGKKADMILIDLACPNMQPIHNITKNLVYSGSKQNIKMTMINGRILYEDGRYHIGVEEKEVYQRVNSVLFR